MLVLNSYPIMKTNTIMNTNLVTFLTMIMRSSTMMKEEVNFLTLDQLLHSLRNHSKIKISTMVVILKLTLWNHISSRKKVVTTKPVVVNKKFVVEEPVVEYGKVVNKKVVKTKPVVVQKKVVENLKKYGKKHKTLHHSHSGHLKFDEHVVKPVVVNKKVVVDKPVVVHKKVVVKKTRSRRFLQ